MDRSDYIDILLEIDPFVAQDVEALHEVGVGVYARLDGGLVSVYDYRQVFMGRASIEADVRGLLSLSKEKYRSRVK